MKLAKPFIDIGLMTTRPDVVGAFWRDEAGAVFDHVLPIRRGHKQHRYDLQGSVLKINAVEALPAAPAGGYTEVLIVRPGLTALRPLTDPDGNRLTLVPPGYLGVTQIAVRVGVRDSEIHRRFYRRALQLPVSGEGAFCAGESLILVDQAGDAPSDAAIQGPGFRYLTFQVHDAPSEHARFLANGGFAGTPVQRMGDVAIIAMVRDPDGNWLELSQRASLTGPLDPE